MKKAILILLFFFTQLYLFSQSPAYFSVTGKTGTGNCDGTIYVQSCCAATYMFSPPGYTMPINYSNLCPLTYTATINCSGGSYYDFTITYGVNTATVGNFSTGTNVLSGFSHFVSSTNPFPNCNGMMILDIQGGIPPYTITWQDSLGNTLAGQNNDTLFNVCSGNYTFTLKDNSTNCYGTGGTTFVKEVPKKNRVKVFPSPSNGKFQIMNDESGITKYELKIYNIVGEKVYQSEISNKQSVIDISNQPKGVYFVHITSEQGTAMQKILINK
jgi:hypothetical protein